MEVHQLAFSPGPSPIALVMQRQTSASSGVLIGTAHLKAGQRVPEQGESAHPADEYSYILRGRVVVGVGDQVQEYGPGTLMLIPAGEGHFTEGIEDAEVLWWWAGHPADFDPLCQQYGPLPEVKT